MLLRKRSEGLLEKPLLQFQSGLAANGIASGSAVRELSRIVIGGAPALDLRSQVSELRSELRSSAAAASLAGDLPAGAPLYGAGRRRRTPVAGAKGLGQTEVPFLQATGSPPPVLGDRGDDRDAAPGCERDGAGTDVSGADATAERQTSNGRLDGDRRAATPTTTDSSPTPSPPVVAGMNRRAVGCSEEARDQVSPESPEEVYQPVGSIEQGPVGNDCGIPGHSQSAAKLSVSRGKFAKAPDLMSAPCQPATLPSADSQNGANRPTDIVIHVCDEARRVRRDFKCNLDLLLTHMKYFESYLAGVTSGDDVDILVHCDVGVFEWLAEYMVNPSKAEVLDVNIVVSILISSHFLQMDRLVDTCLGFMRESINQVLRLPIDLSCLSNELVRRLARLFVDEDLELVRDRKDRLTSRLYAHKLEELLADEENTLYRCAYCRGLFTARQRELTVCPKAEIFIDFHGNVIAQHVADTDWDVSHYVQYCREVLQLPWREIYWRIWARVHMFRCSVCHQYFCGAELGHCSYHPEKPVWNVPPRAHAGVYPCCQQPALRFGASIRKTGCHACDHVFDVWSQASTSDGAAHDAAVFEKLLRHKATACVSFEDREKDLLPDTGECDDKDGSGAAAGPVEDEEEEHGEDEDSEGDEGCVGGTSSAVGATCGGGFVSQGSDGQQTYHWADAANGRESCYCFDPPPEHRYLLNEGAGRSLLSPDRRARRGVAAGTRGNSTGGAGRIQDPNSTRTCIPAARRGGAAARTADRRARGSTATGPSAATVPTAGIAGNPRKGGVGVRRGSGGLVSSWPGPTAEGTSTFFNCECPPGVSSRRALDYKMDMLREDDRRRMDELGERIRSRRQECARQSAVGNHDTVLQRMQSLAWLGDAAAHASAAAPAAASPAPRRRGSSLTGANRTTSRAEASSGAATNIGGSRSESGPSRAEARQQPAERERAASRGRAPSRNANTLSSASGHAFAQQPPAAGISSGAANEISGGVRPSSAPMPPPASAVPVPAGNRHGLGSGSRRG